MKNKLILFVLAIVSLMQLKAQTWTADNGNGTFTNPLFFEEFSDPCMIRVGQDFYITGTTMHTMPGLPILHSRDLVNWRLVNYAFDRFDLGPEFSFQEGKEMYGQGIWAPSFAYKDSTFYIFANINGYKTQIYKTQNPYGQWEHTQMKTSFHDLSIFFDTDGKNYVCWGADKIFMARLNKDLTDTIPGTTQLIAEGVGEGSHVYKVNDDYIIIWAKPGNNTPQFAGKSKNIYGPYEVVTISDKNHMGVHAGYSLKGGLFETRETFDFSAPNENNGMTLHQGGIIDTPTGEWWGYSMQDHNSLGRITHLTPVTWENGFPYYGLPGNLAKSPKTWVKPDVGLPQQPIVPIAERYDYFSSDKLGLLWQWNHLPDDSKWSLTESYGKLRLYALPAINLWFARNTLTQRAMGMDATCSVDVDATNLKDGDIAGLALLNHPYAWIGIGKSGDKYKITMYDQAKPGDMKYIVIDSPIIRFAVNTNFETEEAQFYYSTDNGVTLQPLGDKFIMVFQLKTFQGVRYALFNYNEKGSVGGSANFDNYQVDELYPSGFRRPIPYDKTITLLKLTDKLPVNIDGCNSFNIVDMSLGRVALQCTNGYLSVNEKGDINFIKKEKAGKPETFQWTELEDGSLVLLSLLTNRYLQVNADGTLNALKDVPSPNKKDGTRFEFKLTD